MYHRMSCCAITLSATLSIIINQCHLFCRLLETKKAVPLDLFHAHFIRLKMPISINIKVVKLSLNNLEIVLSRSFNFSFVFLCEKLFFSYYVCGKG